MLNRSMTPILFETCDQAPCCEPSGFYITALCIRSKRHLSTFAYIPESPQTCNRSRKFAYIMNAVRARTQPKPLSIEFGPLTS